MRPYPGHSMHDVGCRLNALHLTHPNDGSWWKSLSQHLQDERITFAAGPVGIEARVQTPHGIRTLN